MRCECGSIKIHTDPNTGEVTCMQCGLVLTERGINYGRDARVFEPHQFDRLRYGEFQTPDKTALAKGSMIKHTDINTQNIQSEEKRASMFRMRREQMKAINMNQERNITIAMAALTKICSMLKMPHYLKEEAAFLYRKILKNNLVRGRSIDEMVAASLYGAARIHGHVLSLDEISEAMGVERKAIARSYRLIHTEIDMNVKLDKVKPHLAEILIRLQLPGRVERRCIDVLDIVVKKRLTHGRRPAGIAAAIIYIVAKREMDISITQKEIAEEAGITEVTLRNRYRGLLDNIPELSAETAQVESRDHRISVGENTDRITDIYSRRHT